MGRVDGVWWVDWKLAGFVVANISGKRGLGGCWLAVEVRGVVARKRASLFVVIVGGGGDQRWCRLGVEDWGIGLVQCADSSFLQICRRREGSGSERGGGVLATDGGKATQ